MVLIGADTSEVTAALDRTGRQVAVLETKTKAAGAGTKQFEGVLRSLAAQATGSNAQLLRLSTLLSSFAVSGGVTLGVLGGLAAMGFAYRKLTEDIRATRE